MAAKVVSSAAGLAVIEQRREERENWGAAAAAGVAEAWLLEAANGGRGDLQGWWSSGLRRSAAAAMV